MAALLIVYLFALGITIFAVVVLYRAIVNHAVSSAQKRFGSPSAGRLTRFKNLGYHIVLFIADPPEEEHGHVLRAAARVLSTNPRTVFAFSSDSGNGSIKLLARAKNLGIKKNLYFVDAADQGAHDAADLFVMPTSSHTPPLRAAMHAGVPGIVSTQCAISETGSLICADFSNPERLAKHIRTLLAEPLRREVLARRVQNEARTVF